LCRGEEYPAGVDLLVVIVFALLIGYWAIGLGWMRMTPTEVPKDAQQLDYESLGKAG
jgi:hypothetical protein